MPATLHIGNIWDLPGRRKSLASMGSLFNGIICMQGQGKYAAETYRQPSAKGDCIAVLSGLYPALLASPITCTNSRSATRGGSGVYFV